MTERYNGWTNYETWVANLWLDEEGNYWREKAQDIAEQKDHDREDSVYELGNEMWEFYQELMPITEGMYADLLGAAMSCINWHEIAGHYVDQVIEEKPDEIEE